METVMDLFGIKGHDERHDEEDRLLRRLVEQSLS